MSKTGSQDKATQWIERLNLQPHPEGGWYRECYRSQTIVQLDGYSGPRAAATSIYYLLRHPDFSAFHRLRTDETWHFYDGGPVIIHELTQHTVKKTRLGCDPYIESTLQYTVHGNTWFAVELDNDVHFALMGCAVAPGFDFVDFELASRARLQKEYPQHSPSIDRLCAG